MHVEPRLDPSGPLKTSRVAKGASTAIAVRELQVAPADPLRIATFLAALLRDVVPTLQPRHLATFDTGKRLLTNRQKLTPLEVTPVGLK